MKDIRIISLLLIFSVLFTFSACSRSAEPTSPSEEQQSAQTQENQPTSESETENSADDSLQQNEEEPTEEELIELLDKAMNEINSLATNPTDDVLFFDIFDRDIECDYSNQIIIDGIPYQWTSRQYSELVDYYSQTFTGEALNWILDTRFADVDGVLYAFAGGGATGTYSKAVSIEKLEQNTYRAHYQMFSINGLAYEDDTTFSIEKTDAGYKVSDIDHRPDLLDRK